jgi:TolB-like protein
MEVDEIGTIAALRAHRERVFDPKIAEFRGRIANTAGDSLLIEYASAVDALRCALEVQRETAVRNETLAEEQRLEFRIGINIGDVVVQGEDLLGDGINVAARLQGLSEAGGICISASVYDQVSGKLDLELEDLGEVKLKNIERGVRAYSIKGVLDMQRKARPLPQTPADDSNVIDFSRFERVPIVVLPFKELGVAEQDFLAEGLRLSLHSVLVKLPGFFLLHTAIVEGYRESDVSAVDAGRAVDVRYVVSGTVQRVGNRVRITIELTDASAQQLIWGERFDRTMEDIFDLQDKVALEIVNALNIELRVGEAGRLRFQTIADPNALAHLHRAVSHLYRGTREDTALARQWAEKLEELEPTSPVGLGTIAITHWRDAKFGWAENPQFSLEQAAVYAQRTIDLGDPEGVGHTIMGHVRLLERRHDEALAASAEAQSKRPSCPLANGLLAEVMRFCGKPDQAITRMNEAMKLTRTFPPWMINTLAAALRDNGEIEASIAAANEAARLFPDDLDGLTTLCCDYILSQSMKEARQVAKDIRRCDPSFSIARYAESQPYKDKATLDRIVENLECAGLPA